MLIVVVSLALTGWHYYVRPYKRQHQAIGGLHQLGAIVEVHPAAGPDWLCRAIGEKFFVDVESVSVVRPFHPPLHPDSSHFDDRVLEHCEQLLNLRRLNLYGSRITDEGLARIQKLRSLESLNLGSTNISDAGLRYIENLTTLQALSLKRTKVSDAGLRRLGKLTQLDYFSLGSPNVRGEGLAFLRRCKQLTQLQFVGESATNEWLQHAGPPTTITWIELHTTSIDESGISLLSSCSQLKNVFLNYNRSLTDDALDHLKGLPIQTIEVSETNVSNEALARFHGLWD